MPNDRPNILLIMTDQQHHQMMGCAGNPYVQTPSMDRIAARGMRFDRAYCANPVCIPSRFSIFTGRMPSEVGIRENPGRDFGGIPDFIKSQGVGHRLREAGYRTLYGGKQHLPRFTAEDIGFEVYSEDERAEMGQLAARHIRERGDQPFFMVASFINPHDICYMAIRDFATSPMDHMLVEKGATEISFLDEALKLPAGMDREAFFRDVCPPLPENLEPQEDEPEAIRELIGRRPFREKARASYTDEQWRLHRWAYANLTTQVDREMAPLIAALDETDAWENTLVIFTSDHGDNDASHRLEHKTVFYDESARIPFIAAMPGKIAEGELNTDALVNNGLDILPTVADYAGIPLPDDLRGRSLRTVFEGSEAALPNRDYVIVENSIGNMIVSGGYKYMRFDAGAGAEQLIDLADDPWEMRNAANDADKADILAQHRGWFAEAFPNH